MIYTLTVNPSLDYIVDVEHFCEGKVNRTFGEKIVAGGKGINVSIVLNNLGVRNRALGFAAGFTGHEIELRLREKGVDADFIRLEGGVSRINVKLRSDCESEINGMGPNIPFAAVEELYARLDSLCAGDILVLAGSIPSCLSESFYSDVMARLEDRGVLFVVDASGSLLKRALCHGPFLVKPNNHELGGIFGVAITSREEAVPYALRLREMGARNVLVSLAGEGAVLAAEDGKVYSLPAPRGTLVNSVGAGDSMVAGFIAGYEKSHSYEEALRMGICTGSASAFSGELADAAGVEALLANGTPVTIRNV